MRPIDADKLQWELAQMWYDSQLSITGISVSELINKQSTIDASPFIRCKDCTYYQEDSNECGMEIDWFYMPNDGFCSRAERRE